MLLLLVSLSSLNESNISTKSIVILIGSIFGYKYYNIK